MKTRKTIIIFAVFSFILLVAVSVYAVMNYSEDEFRAQSIETVKQSEGRDNHHAVGENLLEQDFDRVINNNGSFSDIVENNEVTVVNFFASWCEPCKRETPDLNQYYNDQSESPVEVVGINLRDSAENRDRFLETYEVEYPIFEFSDESEAIDQYHINLMPTTFFLNSEGDVVRAYIGEITPEQLTSYIEYVKEAS